MHSPQIQGFFHVPVDHLYARYVLCDHVTALGIHDLVVCSPDIGFAKGGSAYANYLGVRVVIGNKLRRDHSEKAEVLEVMLSAHVHRVLVTDDEVVVGIISTFDVLQHLASSNSGQRPPHVRGVALPPVRTGRQR